jgi:hypothetical protein
MLKELRTDEGSPWQARYRAATIYGSQIATL